MKKIMMRKISTALLVAAMFGGGVFAQTAIPGYDDGASGSNYVNTTIEATTDVTIGKTIPLYADPDSYYHPSYDPITGNGLTTGFSWTWSTTAGTGSVTLGTGTDNYNTITGGTVGTATVSVVENGPLCSDGTSEDITINILAEPSASLSSTTNLELCVGNAGLPSSAIQATITDNSATDYHLVWTLEIYTENSSGTADEWFDASLGSLGAAQDYAEEYTLAAPDESQTAPGTFNLTAAVPNLLANADKTTVYEYTLTSINDLVSRRGDFLTIDGSGDVNSTAWDDFTYYTVGETLTITIHPTPKTGPIYHISNTWAQ
jgi:hypothetical protein